MEFNMWQGTKYQVGRVLSHPITVGTVSALFLAAVVDGASTAVCDETNLCSKPYYGERMLGSVGLGQNYGLVAYGSDWVVSTAADLVSWSYHQLTR
jgi:hypothetical protein